MKFFLWCLALLPCFLWLVFFVTVTAQAFFFAVMTDSLSTFALGLCGCLAVWGGMHVALAVCGQIDANLPAEVE